MGKIRGNSISAAIPGMEIVCGTYVLVVLTGMGTTALLAGGGSNNGLHSALLDVAEFEGLNEVTIGDQR